MPAPQEDDNGEVQFSLVSSQLPDTIEATLEQDPITIQSNYVKSNSKTSLRAIILYLKDGTLPEDVKLAKKVVVESTVYTICNDVLYYVGSKQMETAHVVVPQQLCQRDCNA